MRHTAIGRCGLLAAGHSTCCALSMVQGSCVMRRVYHFGVGQVPHYRVTNTQCPLPIGRVSFTYAPTTNALAMSLFHPRSWGPMLACQGILNTFAEFVSDRVFSKFFAAQGSDEAPQDFMTPVKSITFGTMFLNTIFLFFQTPIHFFLDF